MTEIEIKNFFSIAETKIKLTEQIRNYYAKEMAPDFNSFDFWQRQIDENKVSSILAFFLDPNEKHEQGDIYLRHFLKKFGLDFFHFDEDNQIKVQCEFTTDKGRRIDIVIWKKSFEQAIAIENKIHPNTTDGNNQVKDYLDFLTRKTDDNFCLIYLSPQEKTVSTDSISSDDREKFSTSNKLKIRSYEEHMIECLNDFGNLTQNFRVKSFLKDFEKTLRKMYMGEKDIDSKQVITDLINENVENLEISLSVSNSLEDVKNQFKQKLEKELLEIGEELGLECIDDDTRLKPSKWTKHRIAFRYEMGGLLYGVQRLKYDKNKSGFLEIEELIKTEMKDEFRVSEWWSMWQFFYRNIKNNKQFWLDIKSGRAKDRARQFVKLINDNFNNDKY